jgi:transposase-like protein
MAGKKGQRQYSRELKEQAVRMALEHGLTYPEITAALGIRDPGRMKVWMRVYRREGAAAFGKSRGRPRQDQSLEMQVQRLRMENTLLKKFHSELRKARLAKRNIG